MPRENYWDIEKITATTWKLYEDYQTTMYLVCGSERACLIDTGYGGDDLPALIRTLTDLPLVVVNTHGHIDHVLGNRFFDSVYLNHADLPIYKAVADSFAEIVRSDEIREQYAEVIDLLDADSVRFPDAVDINDGDVIDLGGVTLEIAAVSGHTPGSIALINRAEGILFSGDAIIENLWMFLDESLPCSVYLDSLRSIKPKLDGIKLIYDGHYSYHPMDISVIDNIIAGTEAIIAGKADGVPFEIDFGKGTEYTFGDNKIICKE